MKHFKTLFGLAGSQVKKTCILMPLIKKDTLKYFCVDELSRGRLYGSVSTPDFTLIHTGVGPAFTGDAVLYLKDTPCKHIILFGSCGLTFGVGRFSLGSLVSPSKSYSNESFSQMLSKDKLSAWAFYPHRGFLNTFLEFSASRLRIETVTCATLASLKLEETRVGKLKKEKIDVVDMECSALFSAAEYVGLRAMAIFYVSDVIKEKPFYRNPSYNEKQTVSSSIKTAANILCEFIGKNSDALS